MKKTFMWLSMLVAGLIVAGCTSVPQEEQQEIVSVKLGVVAPISGPAATYGEDVINAYNLYLTELKEQGVVPENLDIQLIVEDGKCAGKDATSAAQKLINVDKVVAILGGVCSAETIAVAKVAQPLGIPVLSALSSSPDITPLGDYIFRFWSDTLQTEFIANFLATKKLDRVAIVYENTDYAIALKNALEEKLEGTISYEEKYNPEEKDFSIISKNIARRLADFDVLVLIPSQDAAPVAIIKGLESEGVLDDLQGRILGSETLLTDAVVSQIGELAEGMYGTAFPEDFSSEGKSIMQKFRTQYEVKSTEPFVVLSMDALGMYVRAFAQGIVSSSALQTYLESINESNPYDGLYDSLYFDSYGDGVGIQHDVVQMQSGELVKVY